MPAHSPYLAVDRRTFVKSAIGATGLWVLSDPLLSRALAAVPGASDVAFAQGIACGQVDQTAATLWTQLDGLRSASRLTVEVAKDEAFANVVARSEALADPGAGGTARVRVGGRALQPGERYWYRFETADGVSSPVGRFRTALPPDSFEPVKLAFFACQDFLSGNYAAHRDLAEQDVDLVVCLGDYIYEDAFFENAVRQVPETPDGTVRTYDEYAAQYRTYHSDQFLQAVRASAPLISIWDDHEVEDNYAGNLPGGNSKKRGSRPVPFAQRKAAGYRAFFESMPVIRDAVAPDKIYGATRFGQVDLLALDTRQFRTNQVCNPRDTFIGLCGDLSTTRRKSSTLLGIPQRDFIIERLKSSTAPWKLIANQVMAMSLDLAPGYPLNTDAWDGYAYERSLIADAIARHGVKDVAFFTGDIHTFFAGSVSRTGRHKSVWVDGFGKGGSAVATELVVGSVTSQGIADRFATTESTRNAAARVLDPLIRGANPHLRYSNSAYKGYGLAEATSGALKVQFRAVRDVRKAGAQVFTLARFEIPRGQAVVNQVASGPVAPASRSLRISQEQASQALQQFAAAH